MEHNYKKTAAAVIALALIAAVVLGIVFADTFSPTVIPSGESGTALQTADATIDPNVNIGGVEQRLDANDENAVRNKWGLPSGTVTPISDVGKLKEFLHGSTTTNSIGVLTNDISLTINSISDLGVQEFNGVLDGNGYTISIDVPRARQLGEITNALTVTDEKLHLIESDKSYFEGRPGIDGAYAVGLLTGANRGTIANFTIEYTSSMMIPASSASANDALVSRSSPSYMSAYGVVTGINFGDISNVKIILENDFVGRQQGSQVNAEGRNARSIENTVMVGTLAGMHAGGLITDTHVVLHGSVGAVADGYNNGSTQGWRNAVAVSGGMVGFFVGNDGMLQDSYLEGAGNVQSIVFYGYTDRDNVYDGHTGKGFNAFSGGITGGKFTMHDGHSNRNSVAADMITSTGSTIGPINQQIRGILSSWKGRKMDNNNSDHDNWHGTIDLLLHDEPGVLIDTANYSGTPVIALTFDYDSWVKGLAADFLMPGLAMDGNISGWNEFYSVGESEGTTLEVSIVDNGFRVATITDDYAATDEYLALPPIDDISSATYNYRASSTYTGKYIWSVQTTQAKLSDGAQPTYISVLECDDFAPAMVYTVNFGASANAYEFRYGTIAEYDVLYTEDGSTRTAMMYDGEPINIATLRLTAAGQQFGSNTYNPSNTTLVYTDAEGNVVDHQDTMFPGEYTITPKIEVDEQTYAYFDATNYIVARYGQGDDHTLAVIPASFNVSSTADGGNWTNSATFVGELNTTSYASYGQPVPDEASNIFEGYSYVVNTRSEIFDMSGHGFRFEDKETTPVDGRTYTAFEVYKRNSAGENVVVGRTSASLSLVIKIDNAAPVLTDTRYYTYSGTDDITADNIAQHYFNIKNGASEYTDVTAQIGDGGWSTEGVFVVITASDERRAGVTSTNGASIRINAGGSALAPQVQINYGSGTDAAGVQQDPDLGYGNAAAIGYVNNRQELYAELTDALRNTNGGQTRIGLIQVDTTPLEITGITQTYTYFRGPSNNKLAFGLTANVGLSGASVQYLLVAKEDIAPEATEVPSSYESEWVDLGAYAGIATYEIDESFADGAALFVRLVSSQGLYPDQTKRVFVEASNVTSSYNPDKALPDGSYPYFYVDLITSWLDVPYQYITIDGVRMSDMSDADMANMFAKQYDGSEEFLAITDPSVIGEQGDASAKFYRNEDGEVIERATGRVYKEVYIDFASLGQSNVSGQTDYATVIADIQSNGYSAVGTYSQFELVGEATLSWRFEVGNLNGNGYSYMIRVDDGIGIHEEVPEIATRIDYRDYDIGVEGLVKYDPGFADYLVTDGGEPTNEISVPYWGTNAMPLPETFGYPTGFGDEIYFRYAYVGGTDGVFNAGGDYVVAVDAVQIVPEGSEPTDDGWQSFALGADGSGTLAEYDNYNFRFSTQMKLTVVPLGVNITTSQARIEDDGQGGTVLVPESLASKIAYDGMTHVVMATYRDVYGETVNAVVTVWVNPEHTLEASNGISAVGTYYITIAPADAVNYYISNNAEQVFEVVSTTIDIDTAAQTYAYNNGNEIRFELKDGDGVSLDDVKPSQDTVNVIYYNEAGLKVDAPVELGEYEVQIEYVAGEKSMFSTARFASVLTVTKATPEILGMSDNALTYDRGWHTYSDPDDPDDPVRLVNRNLYPDEDGEYYEFGDVGSQLILEYLNDEGEWEAVDLLDPNGAGNFVNAGIYTYRYHFVGDAYYEEVWSDPVTLTINRAVYGTQSTIPTDFLLFKDNTNTAIPTAGTSGSGDDGLPIYTVDYNAKSQYLTAKSETFFDYSGAEPVAIEPGAEITYYREGNLLDTTRPETLNMQLAQDYLVTVTITSNNYQDFVYQMHYVIATIDIPQGAITVTTEGGADITTGTSAEDPQPLSVTYDGKEHGYRADNSGEIVIKYDRTKLLEYDPENASSTPANASITYYPDGNQSNTLVDAGSYSGYYLISVGLTNYKPIRVYVTMTITPADAVATIEQDESITNVTSETNINNVLSGTFIDVNGNEQQGTLVFTDASGNKVTPDDQGRLPAGTYTVTVVDSSGNYVLKGETASLPIAEPDASHVHTDVNGDNVCDSCGANVTGIHVHVDADGDGVCDNCGQQLGGDQPQPHDHVDANGDGKCDVCGAAMDNQGGNDPVDDPDDGGNTATIVGGVLIGVAGLVVVGTVVGVILIVRKKRKNVI